MDLRNSFDVPAGLDAAWEALIDVRRVAPCMPGATLETVDGDDFTGSVKVKLGPVSIVYAGKARFVSKDAAEHVAVIEGAGKETRGSGSAKALVTVRLQPESANQTRAEVVTEVTITGKAAQFGRGVMQDVAGRIIDQFAANLSALMGESSAQSAPAVDPPRPGADGDLTAERVTAERAAVEAQSPRPAPKAADSIDLLSTASLPVLKRVLPVAGVVIVACIIWWIVSR